MPPLRTQQEEMIQMSDRSWTQRASALAVACAALTALPAAADDFVDGQWIGDAPTPFASAAMVHTASTVVGQISTAADVDDTYVFTATHSGPLQVTLQGLTADLDLVLFDGEYVELARSFNAGTNDEGIAWDVAAGKTYYLAVVPYSGALSAYRMQLSLAATTPTGALSSQRVFAYAEAVFPTLFKGTAVTQSAGIFTYRHYPQSHMFLGIDTQGGLYALGDAVANHLSYLGTTEDFRAEIERWERTTPTPGPNPGTPPTLTTRAVGPGQGTVTPATKTHARGSLVTASAQSDFWSDFTGWTERTTQPHCVGSLYACEFAMNANHVAEARFAPTSFVTSFDNLMYTNTRVIDSTKTCVWNVSWRDTRITITNALSGSTYTPKIRIQGRQSYASSRSDCETGEVTIDQTFDAPGLTQQGITGRFAVKNSEYLSIVLGGAFPEPSLNGLNPPGFESRIVLVNIDYVGDGKSGSGSVMGSLIRKTVE
jgi:hypothetical protein